MKNNLNRVMEVATWRCYGHKSSINREQTVATTFCFRGVLERARSDRLADHIPMAVHGIDEQGDILADRQAPFRAVIQQNPDDFMTPFPGSPCDRSIEALSPSQPVPRCGELRNFHHSGRQT